MAKVMDQFEDFQIERNDAICNAAHALIVEMLRGGSDAADEDIQEWDMSLIGELVYAAGDILKSNGKIPCDPYYGDNDGPCPLDTCCKRSDCPFRKEP